MTDKNAGLEKYPNLFAARKIGNKTASNAVKYAACSVSNFNNSDGSITEREMARMKTICGTGAGIITNQGAYPDPEGTGKAYFRQISIADDRFIPALERISGMIHDAGAIAIQQILHAGRYGGIHLDYCLQPSAVEQTLPHFRPPRPMSQQDIRDCIQHHALAARRAMRAGFDGVEVTAFMGYMLANFLSPYTNRRNDEYGGSAQNRGRFMVEMIHAVRDEIGSGTFWIRLNATELMDERGGSTEAECLEYMEMAEEAGVDGISIVIGWHESTTGALGRDIPSNHWLYLAENAKKRIGVPIAFGPRFGDPVLAEKAIAAGKIDFWEVCRPFLADPELLIKVKEDRLREIKPCVGGLMCLSRMFRNLPYVCSMNPVLGHEYEGSYEVMPTAHPKTVFVIGGGPAGMEAAVTAARKGHRVTLFERSDRLGGQLKSASLEIDGGHVFDQLVDYYKSQLEKLQVEVRMETSVDRGMVSKSRPDVCVVATGGTIEQPPLPGLKEDAVIYADRFTDPESVKGKKIFVLGGNRAGLVVGERLAQGGNHVTIVDQGEKIAADVIPTFKWRHMSWVRELKIEVLKDTVAVGVSDEGIDLRDREGKVTIRPFDLLVISGPHRASNHLTRDLIFSCDELYTVGDAVSPRNLCDAVHEGYKIGVRI